MCSTKYIAFLSLIFFIEATGRIYEPFLGRTITRENISVLEFKLKEVGFRLWTTTEHLDWTMISYGEQDGLDNERTLEGYAYRVRGLLASSIQGYQIVARGRNLITFMEALDAGEL